MKYLQIYIANSDLKKKLKHPGLMDIKIPHIRVYQAGQKDSPRQLYTAVTFSGIINFIKVNIDL